ncbi:ANR family transcriptional regulator [Aeromonas piscicola]|uniref:ANR family transcriptional regulator n=1 Tax=Aeromonas piscicola TaxID=600645 RepID=UPI0005B3DAD7|nr:ANR family transcriptional regulator [Aeromonas piscicola]
MNNIRFKAQNPNGYAALSQRAAELERVGQLEEAADMWGKARQVSKQKHNAWWAERRRDFCRSCIKLGIRRES